MLSAYVRRNNGDTQPVAFQHTGQHIGMAEGKVRLARLYWDKEAKGDEEQAGADLLLGSVPLLDVLILTRKDPHSGERVVFHGLISECGTDGHTISLMALDDPKVQHLFDQPFHFNGPLNPTDQPPVPAEPFQPPSAEPNGPANVAQFLPGGAQVRTLGQTTPVDPAARPAGHPAGWGVAAEG